MLNVHSLRTSPSLRRYWHKVCDYLRYAVPEFLMIAVSVIALLYLIERFFFAR